ncbi:hypothetical protein CEY11_24820 [Candidimonas nitroreducens]|uniref:Integrase SAM-like N-terminal domain-containing protein n=1 Tax=Candidimonas nitroreducens TaxID=683354 RepID=A0A225LZJ8_9BURK|nr:hypothetical protein CEY11_24820 [Candidimonas nitroreducens]
MLISTVRFYERILLGLHTPDPDTQEYANSCLSYLTSFLRLRHIELPDHIQRALSHLPEIPR